MSSIRAFTFSDINDILIERDEDDEYEEEFEDVGEEEEEELARQTPQSTPSSSPSSALLLASRRSEALGKVVEFTFDAVAGEEGGSPRGARESQQSDGSRSTSERWEDEASDYNEKVLAAVASRAAASPTTTTTTATAAAAAAVPTLSSQNTAIVPSPGAKGDLLKSLNSALLAERHPKPAATLGAASKAAAAVSAPSSSSGSGGSGRIFSRVHKASPHEIPGYKENVPPASLSGASTHFSATSPPYASASTGPSRHEVVSAILQCLTAATGTAKTNTERKAAIAQGAVSVPTLKMGLTKVQALQASGKLFHRDVADYDPDYDEAVELLQEEQALAQQYRPQPQPAPAAPAPAPAAAAAPRASLAPPTVLSREFEVRQASALSSIRPLISPSGPARLVAPRFSSASASASASARTAASVTFANVGVEGEGREQALQRASGGSSSSRADLSATCESVYASFLSDLVGVCRARAEHCQSAAEMAMLRVLSEQVKEVFAGEEMDTLHAKMISAAASVNKGTKR